MGLILPYQEKASWGTCDFKFAEYKSYSLCLSEVDRGLTYMTIRMHCEFESFVVLQLIDIAGKQNI